MAEMADMIYEKLQLTTSTPATLDALFLLESCLRQHEKQLDDIITGEG